MLQASAARSAAAAKAAAREVTVSQLAAPEVAAPAAAPLEAVPLAVPQRATAQPAVTGTRVARQWSHGPAPDAPPARVHQPPAAVQRATGAVSPPDRTRDSRALEVSHDPEPDRDPGDPSVPFASASWPSSGAGALARVGAFAEPEPFPEAGPFPEYSPFAEAGALPGNEPLPGSDPAPAPQQAEPAEPAEPAPAAPGTARPGRSAAAKVAALFLDVDADRSVPSIERALSGPDGWDDSSWRRRVKVVTGGQGPARPGRQLLDRDRARLPLAGPFRIAVLGCTSGAGQSTTALMIGHVLAAVREVPVAALDLNPGDTSLASRVASSTSVTALLAGGETDGDDPAAQSARGSRARRYRREPAARLDVIAAESPGGNGMRALDPDDYQRLARVLAARYPLTVIDPSPYALPRVLSVADQLVLVVPARLDAATSLANTQQWLSAHGYDGLASRAVTVVNGVSQRTSPDVLRAESAARGRCRAIVRVPWDDLLSSEGYGEAGGALVRGRIPGATLSPQAKRAYAALAGMLFAGLAADPGTAGPATRVRGRGPGEHAD